MKQLRYILTSYPIFNAGVQSCEEHSQPDNVPLLSDPIKGCSGDGEHCAAHLKLGDGVPDEREEWDTRYDPRLGSEICTV